MPIKKMLLLLLLLYDSSAEYPSSPWPSCQGHGHPQSPSPPPPPPWPVGVGSLRDSAPSDCEGDWGTQRLLSVCSKEEIALFLRRQKSKYFWNPFHSSGFLLLTYVNGFTKVLCFSQFINNGILQRSLIADKGLHWSTKKSQKKDQAFPRSSK